MKILGTIKRGKVKITSQKQINFLEARHLPYTRFTKEGHKVRRNVK